MRRPDGPRSPAELVAAVVVALRYLVVPAWVAVAIAAVVLLPQPGEAGGGALGSLVPENTPALLAQRRSADLFAFPVLSNTAVVQRDPRGLTPSEQARVFERAARLVAQQYPELLSAPFALPLVNTFGLVPGSREAGTTAITFLFFEPGTGLVARRALARYYVNLRARDDIDTVVGVTGVAPAQVRQGELIEEALPLIELATVVLIALVIGVNFRSVVAPVLTLASVGIAYLVALGVVGTIGEQLGTEVPKEVAPILLVLLLGLVTDYCIFFLSGVRHRFEQGDGRVEAARRTAADYTPIIGTAGLIVAAGAASLVVARLEFFRIFGPALAVTVLVGLAVSLTFVPALLAMLGPAVFWPGRPRPAVAETARVPSGGLVGRLARSRPVSAVLVVVIAAGLGIAAARVPETELTLTPIESLPGDTAPARAARAAAQGFAPGVLMPTLLLVEEATLPSRPDALERLQPLIAAQPGVAGVIGPGNLPGDTPRGVLVAPGGVAARYIVFLEDPPLSPEALDTLAALRDELPRFLDEVGLPAGTVSIGGNTAIAQETVRTVVGDLFRIGATVLIVNFVLLVLFLRSLIAPLYLLAASALAVAATLGLTAWVFEDLLGGNLTYYIPFMAAVLLVSLGSDYNVFLVGRIWQEARVRRLPDAIAVAAPRASRAIAVAAIALALSFGLLAIVPLESFRQLAFAMVVGVLLDAFVVRSWLVPALLTLAGPVSGWPGRLGRARVRAGEVV